MILRLLILLGMVMTALGGTPVPVYVDFTTRTQTTARVTLDYPGNIFLGTHLGDASGLYNYPLYAGSNNITITQTSTGTIIDVVGGGYLLPASTNDLWIATTNAIQAASNGCYVVMTNTVTGATNALWIAFTNYPGFVTTQETARVLDWTNATVLMKDPTSPQNPVTKSYFDSHVGQNVILYFHTNDVISGVYALSPTIPTFADVTYVATNPAVGDYIFRWEYSSTNLSAIFVGGLDIETLMRRTGNPASAATVKWEGYIVTNGTPISQTNLPEYAETAELYTLPNSFGVTPVALNCYAPYTTNLTSDLRLRLRCKLVSASGSYGNIEIKVGATSISDVHLFGNAQVAATSGSTEYTTVSGGALTATTSGVTTTIGLILGNGSNTTVRKVGDTNVYDTVVPIVTFTNPTPVDLIISNANLRAGPNAASPNSSNLVVFSSTTAPTNSPTGVVQLWADIGVGALPTGGTVTTVGTDRVHTFTNNGTLVVSGSGVLEYLIVAGGGSGGSAQAGGGGAGGYLYNSSYTVNAGNYAVVVGLGGVASTAHNVGNNGQNSSFGTVVATGGGGGGSYDGTYNGKDGGSGGGGGGHNPGSTGGNASPAGQGNAGGSKTTYAPPYNGAGGGGAGGGVADNSGDGGVGLSNSIVGSVIWYAGGGGGCGSGYEGTGGTGGGGNGSATVAGTPGVNGTGGGGGGSEGDYGGVYGGAKGGDGIVIVRYNTNTFSTSCELRVRDSSGNVTTLSPHNTSLLPSSIVKKQAFPMTYYSRNDALGYEMNVDLLSFIQDYEKVSGKQYIYVRKLSKGVIGSVTNSSALTKADTYSAIFTNVPPNLEPGRVPISVVTNKPPKVN